MILKSKRKDYYDFIVGIYGRDENKVYERKDILLSENFHFDEGKSKYKNIYSKGLSYNDQLNTLNIYISNKLYSVCQVEENVWEQVKFHKTEKLYNGLPLRSLVSEIKEGEEDNWGDFEIIPESKSLNIKYREPIIAVSFLRSDKILGTPLLSDFGFPKFLDPYTLYSDIDTFLGWLKDNPEPENKTTDLEKLESKGFDNKISFRHRKP